MPNFTSNHENETWWKLCTSVRLGSPLKKKKI